MEWQLDTKELQEKAKDLRAGDRVLLSGEVFTSRDAAHKRIMSALDNGEELPFEIKGASIYYAGPTPTPDNLPIGSCGPTTSGRMDPFAPRLYDLGLSCTIGKGERSKEVCDAIKRNGAVYLCAVGGAGALACKSITSCEVIAYEDLGCESVKQLRFDNFPLIVAIDSNGGNLFERNSD